MIDTLVVIVMLTLPPDTARIQPRPQLIDWPARQAVFERVSDSISHRILERHRKLFDDDKRKS